MAIRVPGIIVRIVNDTGIIAPPIFQRYPVIIGEGDPYRTISDYRIRKTADDYDGLGAITTVNDIVSVGDLPGIASYVATTDYELSGNNIHWVGVHKPDDGDYYYATYTETRPASAYVPMLYFDENLIYADHGNQTRTSGAINDVSVGASLALSAGSGGVIVMQLDLSSAADPDVPTPTELENAFIDSVDLLNRITNYKLFLVPMSSGTLVTTTAANIFFNHAVIASQPARKQERTVVASLAKGVDYQGAATFAISYFHERMVVPYVPDATVNVVGFTADYDMRFYSAALTGKLCSVSIGRNISDEIIPNVSFPGNFSPDEADYLVQRGVSPAKVSGAVVRNIMAITTDTTNALTEDLGVQDVKDYVKKYWREGLWTAFKNAPITRSLIAQVRAASVGILDYLVSQGNISEYRELAVSQDITEPRKLLVSAKIKPAFGLQWMDITFTFVMAFTG